MGNATQRAIARREKESRMQVRMLRLQAECNRLHADNARLRETRSYALSDAAIRRATVNRATVTIERRDIAALDTHNANRNAARHSNVTDNASYDDAW